LTPDAGVGHDERGAVRRRGRRPFPSGALSGRRGAHSRAGTASHPTSVLDPVRVDGDALAGVMAAERSEAWAGVTRQRGESFADGPGPVLAVYPAGTPARDLPPGQVFRKRHTTMVLSWPEAAR
jgi:hypothetical protein